MMAKHYEHLGIYSDLTSAAFGEPQFDQKSAFPIALPGLETQKRLREVLNWNPGSETAFEVRVERGWQRDGVWGEEISWSVGYGPRTFAFYLRPSGEKSPLPGVVALHDHGGFKFYGKEKIADGPDETPDMLREIYRPRYYGGRAFANALACEGYAVLVPDTFLWGSRHFPYTTIPENLRVPATPEIRIGFPEWGDDQEIADYNLAAIAHENVVEKYLRVLGTTLAGVVSYEDRIAVNYLASREDVVGESVACIGLSGGGARATLLQGTSSRIGAAVVVGLMSTYEGLCERNVCSHTWMIYPADWARYGDWADIAACRAPSPLLSLYDIEDEIFTQEGMRDAHERLKSHYTLVAAPENYRGIFYPGPHKFDLAMQSDAFAWLKTVFKPQIS